MPFNFLPGGGEAGALIAPPGTSIPMAQASAPFGWTSSPQTDVALRYNSGSGGSTGGATGWSTWNGAGTYNANAVTLSVGNLPAHNHSVTDPTHTHVDAGHVHQQNTATIYQTSGNIVGSGALIEISTGVLNTSAGFASINNAATNITINNTGSGTAFTPTVPLPNVKFVDHILAVKS